MKKSKDLSEKELNPCISVCIMYEPYNYWQDKTCIDSAYLGIILFYHKYLV